MKTRKTKIFSIGLLSVFFALVLSGCSSTPAAENLNHALEEWRHQESASLAKSVIEEFDTPVFNSALGFDVIAYPNTTELKPYKFFAIEHWIGQIQYLTPDERILVVRVAKEDGKRLLSTYSEPHTIDMETRTIDGIEVEIRHSPEKCTAVVWKRNGFQYLVHSRGTQGPMTDAEIEAFVKGLDSVILEKPAG